MKFLFLFYTGEGNFLSCGKFLAKVWAINNGNTRVASENI